MFSDIPKLFDRNFAIGFLIPTALWFNLSTWLLNTFGYFSIFSKITEGMPLLKGKNAVDQTSLPLMALMVFFSSIVILILNIHILKICEGYYHFPCGKKLSWLQARERRRFRELRKKVRQGDEKARKKLCMDFPPFYRWVIPTAFGNTIKSFETYSKIVYGLDALPGWDRLCVVVPSSYMESINSSKAFVDFWANLWFLSLLLSVEYFLCAVYWEFDLYNHNTFSIWPPFFFGIAALIFSYFAKSSAAAWGEEVKTAFDLFIFELSNKIGLIKPKNAQDEKEIWRAFTQMITFRDPGWRNRLLEINEEQILKAESASKDDMPKIISHRD